MIRRAVLVLLVCFIFSGCAPQLGLRMNVPSIPEPTRTSGVPPRGEPVRVRVGNFLDSRASDTIAIIDGREVGSEGSPGSVVQQAFEQYLHEAGAAIVLFNAPSIEGEIVEWQVKVTPKFPASEATAKARLKVEIRGAGSRVLYRATYSGEATSVHPLLRESGVSDLLASAMGSAIEEAVHDEDLVNNLALTRTE